MPPENGFSDALDWSSDYSWEMDMNKEYPARVARVGQALADAHSSAMIVTPGSDLVYLTGYNAIPLERITALVIAPDAAPFLVVPRLEISTALASPFGDTGWDVHGWGENDDPYAIIRERIPSLNGAVLVDNHMWAERVLTIQKEFPQASIALAAPILAEIRMRKTPYELDALREAAAAIDRVHARVAQVLRAGRSEADVARDISEMIIAEGHQSVDFVIVASGPNGASPHHEVSDRVIQLGDPVVVDIGGTMPSGYCSDCTRTYSVGDPGSAYRERYAALQLAQEKSTRAVSNGAISHDIDAAGRNELESHDLAQYFIHRTGHGIGLDTHEEPYIGIDNPTVIEENMVFSIEPGFYIDGVHGARIEDIVICTANGPESINKQTRDLVIIEQ
jgi:Xaa-Pro aminopeptidase